MYRSWNPEFTKSGNHTPPLPLLPGWLHSMPPTNTANRPPCGWLVGWWVGCSVGGWLQCWLLVGCSVGWVVGRLVVGRLVGWLQCRLVAVSVGWLVEKVWWLQCWLVGWLVGWLVAALHGWWHGWRHGWRHGTARHGTVGCCSCRCHRRCGRSNDMRRVGVEWVSCSAGQLRRRRRGGPSNAAPIRSVLILGRQIFLLLLLFMRTGTRHLIRSMPRPLSCHCYWSSSVRPTVSRQVECPD